MIEEMLRGIPHIHFFSTDGAPDSVTVHGPTPTVITPKSIVQIGGSDHYKVVFTPMVVGSHLISVYDAGSVLLCSERKICVDATQTQYALGLQPSYHGLATVWPTNVYLAGGGTVDMTCFNNYKRAFFEAYKYVVPYDGYIYGIYFYADADIPSFDLFKFITLYNSAGNTWLVRDTSENFAAETPSEGSWSDGWCTYFFNDPVFAKAGDSFGFYMENTSGATKTCGRSRTPQSASAAVAEILVINAQLNETGDNTASIWSTGVHNIIECKLYMQPPDIVLAGHSIWAGHCAGANQSASVYENYAAAYVVEDDPAAMLAEMLGVSVCNVADGGTGIASWIGDGDLFDVNVAPLRPSLVLFDTVYNDKASSSSGYANSLGELLAHCAEISACLAMLEAPPSYYAAETAADHPLPAAYLEEFNYVTHVWCEHNGVLHIPLHHRCGEHGGGDWHDSLRRHQKHGMSGLDDYYDFADDNIHLSRAGRRAAMVGAAEVLRRGAPSRLWAPVTTQEEVRPEYVTASPDLAFDPASDKVILTDIDGIDFEIVFAAMLAILAGKTVVDGSDITFERRDGTGIVTITIGTTPGERTTSAIVGE